MLSLAPRWLFLVVLLVAALAATPAAAQTGTIGLNFTGVTLSDEVPINIGGNTFNPPDNNGAVGPSNIVQLINGAFAVYDKSSGSRQELISSLDFWTQAGANVGNDPLGLGVFNSRILYDPVDNRWIAAGVTVRLVNNTNSVVLARSNTADPRGGWQSVQFAGNTPDTGNFADFTRLGINANGVYVGVDNFFNSFPNTQSLFSIPKADLLAASPSVANLTRFDGVDTDVTGSSATPVINFGPATAQAAVLGTTPSIFYRTNIVGANAAGAQLQAGPIVGGISSTPPPLAAQPDGTRQVSTIDSRFTANVYQVGNIIYAAHAVQTTGPNSVIDWVKFDAATNAVLQEGILSSPNFDYFQPAIAANANGDVVLSFTRSGLGAGGNLSDFAIVGKTVGGVTTFGDPFLLKASSVGDYHYVLSKGNITGVNRWGDYMTMQVDPSNPNVFWTFEEYIDSENSWSTLITQITVPEPSSVVLSAFALAALSIAAWRRARSK